MTFLAGLGLMLSLIVAIGAQNVYVLRQGIRREYVVWVVAICAVSDAVLVAVGVSGIGMIVTQAPWLITGARWAGAAFLIGYAVLAARRALKPSEEEFVAEADVIDSDPVEISVVDTGTILNTGASAGPELGAHEPTAKSGSNRTVATQTISRTSLRTVILTCLALTWLNPHVYLDTVFLIGTVATSHGDARWLFAAGAMTGSVLWFAALGYGARMLGRLLSKPGAWRVLDGIIAVVMTVMAIMLLVNK